MDDMLSEVEAYLARSKGSWPRIAAESNVGYQWLTKVAAGRIPDPGYRKVRRVYEHMRGQKVDPENQSAA